jgi:hypothetical protein
VTDLSNRYGEAEFQAIETALSHTDQGRWFLSEYLARNTSMETLRLLDALHRLGANLDDVQVRPSTDQISTVLSDIDVALCEALRSFGDERRPDRHIGQQHGAETAIETILEAVEDVQSFVCAVQTRNVQLRLGEKIEARLRVIVSACSQVEGSNAQAMRAAQLLYELRQRLNALRGAARRHQPAPARQIPESLLLELAQALR